MQRVMTASGRWDPVPYKQSFKKSLWQGETPQESSPLRRGKHSMAFSQKRAVFAEHCHRLYLNFAFNLLFCFPPGVSSSSSGAKRFVGGFFFPAVWAGRCVGTVIQSLQITRIWSLKEKIIINGTDCQAQCNSQSIKAYFSIRAV